MLDPEAPAEEEVDEDPNWNPSGLSESSLKRLAIGFYGWEQHVCRKPGRVERSPIVAWMPGKDRGVGGTSDPGPCRR